MKIAALFLSLSLSAAVFASAQATPSAAPAPPADTPPLTSAPPAATLPNLHRIVRDLKISADNIKSEGNFGAQLWLIADSRFFQNWRKPESPSIDPVETAVRGQPIFTVIVFYGPSRDEKGQASVTYDFEIHRPDGTVYAERKDLVGYQAAGPVEERMLEIGRNYLNINIGPDDPAGKYMVEAIVRDAVAKVSVTLKKEFVVQ